MSSLSLERRCIHTDHRVTHEVHIELGRIDAVNDEIAQLGQLAAIFLVQQTIPNANLAYDWLVSANEHFTYRSHRVYKYHTFGLRSTAQCEITSASEYKHRRHNQTRFHVCGYPIFHSRSSAQIERPMLRAAGVTFRDSRCELVMATFSSHQRSTFSASASALLQI